MDINSDLPDTDITEWDAVSKAAFRHHIGIEGDGEPLDARTDLEINHPTHWLLSTTFRASPKDGFLSVGFLKRMHSFASVESFGKLIQNHGKLLLPESFHFEVIARPTELSPMRDDTTQAHFNVFTKGDTEKIAADCLKSWAERFALSMLEERCNGPLRSLIADRLVGNNLMIRILKGLHDYGYFFMGEGPLPPEGRKFSLN